METLIEDQEILNRIGLNEEKSEELANHLNKLLANYSVFYQNVRGYHWNIQGGQFFTLHEKFEELYVDLFQKIDAIAERSLTLGYHPDHNFTKYLSISDIPESHEVKNGQKAVEEILSAFKILLQKQRTILNLSTLSNDEGTNALMSDYITEQEKIVWMYSAYLKTQIFKFKRIETFKIPLCLKVGFFLFVGMNIKLDEFYESHNEPNQSCLLALRDIILDFDINLAETIKYGMPCFIYKKKNFCYLWTDKISNNPYILIVEGRNIDHPLLVEGNRKRMRILSIDPNKDIPISDVYEIFYKALELYKSI